MATLEAVVSVRDNASAKFTTMRRNARRFEQQLEDVNRELDKIGVKLAALTSKKWTIHLDYDRNLMGRALSGGGGGLNPNAAMLGVQLAARSGPNPGGSGGGGAALARAASGAVDGSDFKNDFSGLGTGGGFFRFIVRNAVPITKMLYNMGKMITEALVNTLAAFVSKGAQATALGAKLASSLGKVGGVLTAIVVPATAIVSLVTAITMGLQVLGSLIFSLAVPIAAIIPALTALGAAIAFVGFPMFQMFSKTKELVDQKEKLREELKQLTPGTDAYNKKLKELNETQKELNKNGGELVWSRATKLFEELKSAVFNDKNNKIFVDILDNILLALKPLIPVISDAVTKFATVFRDLFAELARWMNSAEGSSFLSRLLDDNMVNLVRTLGAGVGKLVRLFGELSIAIAPVANVLFGKLNNWMDDLSGRLKSGESDLGGWLSEMMPIFTGAIGAIGQALKDLGNFFAEPEMKKYTMMFIEWFKKFVPQLVSFFRDTITKYGPMTISILKFIGKAIALIWSVLTKVLEPFVPLIKLLFDVLNVVIDVARAVLDQLAPAFSAARVVVQGLLWPIQWVIDKIQALLDKLKLLDPRNWPGMLGNLFGGLASSAFGGESPERLNNPMTGNISPKQRADAEAAANASRRAAQAQQFMGNGGTNVIINGPVNVPAVSSQSQEHIMRTFGIAIQNTPTSASPAGGRRPAYGG